MTSSPEGDSGVSAAGALRAPTTSSWAVASLLCGVAMCCPAMTVISILLGLRALVQVNAEPNMRGRGMAMMGITLGVLATLAWIGGAIWWHINARIPMMHGPREELRAGLAGDVERFMAGFQIKGAAAPDIDATTFLNELSLRYGRFIDSAISPNPSTRAPLTGPTELVVSYTLQFDSRTVEAEAMFVTFAPSSVVPQPVFRWGWVRITDPQRGDLVYPVGAPPVTPMAPLP